MPVYTLVISGSDGRQHTTLSDFPNDETAVSDTGQFVSAEHPTAALARGAGPDVEFMGAWDWSDGSPVWTAGGLEREARKWRPTLPMRTERITNPKT